MTSSPCSDDPDALITPAIRALKILAASAILALLYLGRDVLVPVTLPLILSLLVSPLAVLLRLLSSVSGPVGTAAVVMVTLIFALLEHASLRDRLIRLIGSGELRATTHALNDAGERLSRYFVSQLGINVGVAAALGIAPGYLDCLASLCAIRRNFHRDCVRGGIHRGRRARLGLVPLPRC